MGRLNIIWVVKDDKYVGFVDVLVLMSMFYECLCSVCNFDFFGRGWF